jgi:hypothetical protein
MDLLRRIGFADEHLSRRNDSDDNFHLSVVEMERIAVKVAIHLRIGKEDLGRAAFGNRLQHARFFKFLDGLGGQNHGRILLSPRLLSLDHVVPDGFVLHEEPCLIHQERLEGSEIGRIANLVRGPVQHIEQERLQHFRSVAPSMKVESLESLERKRVLGVVEEEAILTGASPSM